MTQQWGRPQPDRLGLPIVVASLVGIALILAREATYGVDWFYDGIYYVSVARSVLAGEGLMGFDGEYLTSWPPLCALALVLVSGFGIFDPAAVFGPLNIAAHGLTVFVVGHYLRQRLESRPLVVWSCLAVALSMPLTDAASTALSEPLFILLTTLALIQTHRLLTHGEKTALFLAATFSALAWQTRYLGVALPAVVGLFLLFQRGAPWPARVWRVTLYSAIVALPMGLWLLRNHLLVAAPLRPWGAGDPSPFQIEAIDVLLSWLDFDLPLVPKINSLTSTRNIVVPLAAALAGLLVVATRREEHSPFDWRPCWLFGGFSVAYLAALSIAAQAGYWNDSHGFQDRFVAPLWVPLLMVATFALDWLFRRQQRLDAPKGLPRVLVGTLGVALALWTADQAMHNVREVRNSSNAETVGDRGGALRSETLRYIQRKPLHGVVFSNLPINVYFYNAGKAEYRGLRSLGLSNYVVAASEEAANAGATDDTYLVWFHERYYRLFPFGKTPLPVAAGLMQVESLADGTIFRVDPGHVPPNPYKQALDLIVAGRLGSPARSTFDVYRVGRTLTYFKHPCLRQDIEAYFFLHFNVAQSNISEEGPVIVRESWNFNFSTVGKMLDGNICVGIVELPPSLPILYARTGQVGGPREWSAEPDMADLRFVPHP